MATRAEMIAAINKDVEKNKKSGKTPPPIQNRDPYPVAPKKKGKK